MKSLLSFAGAIALLFATTVVAEDAKKPVKSGLQAGKSLGAFDVVKCAGEEADNVPLGDKLCYRCRNGSRPQVMVFTKSTGKQVTELVKQLDQHIAKFEDEQLRAFVNVLGDSKSSAEKSVKELAKSAKTKSVPYVVPVEFENGPENYALNPKAEVTIIVGNKSKVVANFAYASADKVDIKAVVGSVKKMFN
ncbi:MAG: hypothetical protein Aurels2KO_37270 [Aureliella sp.]